MSNLTRLNQQASAGGREARDDELAWRIPNCASPPARAVRCDSEKARMLLTDWLKS